ncbi:MAG: L-serine ammonia-lyase, iron-sulfur-dependent, subunit alpha [Clostridiales bacterium]|nr:L-serine ammonia-lyase, iron-sulfur-dependent, subunit alpha [Clostridiales bacterium]
MLPSDKRYKAYIDILKEELVPAMGCTEPIAIAFAAAKARAVLGSMPDRVEITVSGNIIKNVKSVIVPNTGGLKGIEAAAAAGIAVGDADKVLEVLAEVKDEDKPRIKEFIKSVPMIVRPSTAEVIFDIDITLHAGSDYSRLRIKDYHTNVVLIKRNGETLFEAPEIEISSQGLTDRGLLTIKDIVDFADTVELDDVREVLERQIEYNTAIANEGIRGNWGARVGRVLLDVYGYDVKIRAKAMAAAGSDARMSGCEMPVIIVSGSGNQGMAASLPVIVYAREYDMDEDRLLRALCVSNLVTIHQKTWIGRLSAFCGAVNAGCGAGAGISYLLGGGFDVVAHTLVNSLAIVSGIVCDGAKPSCAAKIASAVDAGILGYQMYVRGMEFQGGDGIISKGVENTIANVGRLGKDGMRETDREILKIMLQTSNTITE